jgi:hypothetical protein
VTKFLRAAWHPSGGKTPVDATTQEAESEFVPYQKIKLMAEDAVNAGPVTLWDVLSGKVSSRIPNLQMGAQAPSAAWDPCSKHRSRLAPASLNPLTSLDQLQSISFCFFWFFLFCFSFFIGTI